MKQQLIQEFGLAIDAGRCLTAAEMAALAVGFSEGPLPWKVDILDLAADSPAVRQAIEPDLTPIPRPP